MVLVGLFEMIFLHYCVLGKLIWFVSWLIVVPSFLVFVFYKVDDAVCIINLLYCYSDELLAHE